MSVVYKLIRPEVKFDDTSGVITATLSTEAEDRDGDVIRAAGWQLQDFLKHPVLLSSHDYSSLRNQIGEWKNLRIEHGKLIGEPTYYHGQGNPEADWAYELAKMGKAAYSVGFVPLEDGPRKGYAGREYTKQELLECSQVTIPSNREALQLMAKTITSGPVHDLLEELLTAKPTAKPRQKWPSNFMGDSDGYGPGDIHCIVPGCDDACQTSIPLCSEHLKYTMNAPAEPPGGELDEELMAANVQARGLRRLYKAGRAISASNMKLLHGALDNLHAVHDAHCTDADCQYAPDDGDEAKGLRHRAMGEGFGSAGGVTVADDGSHEPMTGSHKHSHPTFGAQGADESHSHAHEHDGDASHDHAHAKSVKAEQSTATQNDLPDSAFAIILPGGEKDADGKTTPRSLRKLPHHKPDGSIDLPHLKELAEAVQKNALARVSQADLTDEQRAKAEAHLEAHAKEEKIGQFADEGKAFDLGASLEEAVIKALEAL